MSLRNDSARLVRRLAWDESTARRFAYETAMRVLPGDETRYAKDGRPRQALRVLARWLDGEAGRGGDRADHGCAGAAGWVGPTRCGWPPQRDGRPTPRETAAQVATLTETLGLADVADRFHVPVGMSAAA